MDGEGTSRDCGMAPTNNVSTSSTNFLQSIVPVTPPIQSPTRSLPVSPISEGGYVVGSIIQTCIPTSSESVSCREAGAAPLNQSISLSFPSMSIVAGVDINVSVYQNLFPETHFDCYRTILPWVRRRSRDAYLLLDNVLPSYGPLVARDLGYLLSHTVFSFDLKDLFLPKLYETSINGKKFLHFDSSSTEGVHISICKLLLFEGFVGANIDPMHMVDVAASVGASTIAANEASQLFRDMLGAMSEVKTFLTDSEKQILQRERRFVRFTGRSNVTNDHGLMAAYRELIRQDFDSQINLKTTKLRCLILGASSREVRLYSENPHIFFQLANREGKDVDRTITDCLENLRSMKLKKVKTKLKNIDSIRRQNESICKIDNMLKEWRTNKAIPEQFLLWDDTEKILKGAEGKCTFDVIIFQDVGYNFSKDDWGKIFRTTGAITGYGYMCLPWELLEPNIISPPGYVFKRDGEVSHLAYHGFSNGYAHLTSNWKTLISESGLIFKDFAIGIEFASRIGPMTLVKLYKTTSSEIITRHLELPDFLKSTMLLDIRRSFDRETGKLREDNLVYFAVRTDEFHEVVNYALDIAKESLNYQNVLLYIRRRCSGVSLVSKEIAKTWSTPKAVIPDFADVVFLYVTHLINDFAKFESVNSAMDFGHFAIAIRKFLKTVSKPLLDVYGFFKARDNFHLLVKEVDSSFWQSVVVKKLRTYQDIEIFAGVGPEDNLEQDEEHIDFDILEKDVCSMCDDLKLSLGKQRVICQEQKDEFFFHDFKLTNEELNSLKTKLSETSHDPIGLKVIKEDALKKVPASSFSNEVRVYYLCGPPGTGKSYAIRAMANKNDLIVAPFSRLKQDYTNFEHPNTGEKTTLKFHTQHSAFSALNHTRVFVDEFTAMPYECLAVIVNNCAAKEVFLVGDHRQTSLINEVEGIAISSKIELDNIRTHELVYNFRNPFDAVTALNVLYNYQMKPTNDKMGFSFDQTNNYANYPEHTPLFFKHMTAERFGVDRDTSSKVTVRANQGATYDNVKLIVTKDDRELFNMPSMAIVALSRHRETCVILSDDSDVANIFLGQVKSVDNKAELQNFKKEQKEKDEKTKAQKQVKTEEEESRKKTKESDLEEKKQQVSKQKEVILDIKGKKMKYVPKLTNLFGKVNTDDIIVVDGIKYSKSKNFSEDIPPHQNGCLLKALADLTKNSVESVWHNMVIAIGYEHARAVYNKPLTTDELGLFCILNDVQVWVVSDDHHVVHVGNRGPVIGILRHTSDGIGHFFFQIEDAYNEDILKLETFTSLATEIGVDLQEIRSSPIVPLSKPLKLQNLGGDDFDEFFDAQEQLTIVDDDKNFDNDVHQNIIKQEEIVEVVEENNQINNKQNDAKIDKKALRRISSDTEISYNIKNDIWKDYVKVRRRKSTGMEDEEVTDIREYFENIDRKISKNLRGKLRYLAVKRRLVKFKRNMKKGLFKLGGGAEIQVGSMPSIKTLTVQTCQPEPLQDSSNSFKEMARIFNSPIPVATKLVEAKDNEKQMFLPLEQSSFDSFRMLVEDFATIDEHNFVLSNQESLEYLNPNFDNGTFDTTTLDNLNMRGHPKRRHDKAWSLLNVAPGVTYFKNNLAQSLACLQARYLTKAYSAAFSNESVSKANEIADLFFNEHMDLNFSIFNEQDVYTTTLESEHAMKVKSYDKQTSFELTTDNDVRFNMKDIFKPFKTKIDLFKAGQGISAWSKDMQTIFQTSFRLINKHFISCLRDHVVYDNGLDEHTMMTRVNNLFSMLPSTAVNGVIDATACDSGQNQFTQLIERRILENLGIDSTFLDWYYSQRESYILKGYGVTAKIKGIKTSGEPATLLNNTILMACLMNYLIRGEGPAVLVIKGDDGLKRQANMVHRQEMMPILNRYLKMDFKVDIDIPISFCGYFLHGPNLIPDVVRKSFKILGHRFRDYQHFTEYQQSLRDWILTVNKIGLVDVCAITASAYDLGYDYCYSLFHSVVSLTHINEKQFRKTFILKDFDWSADYVSTEPWTSQVSWYTGHN